MAVNDTEEGKYEAALVGCSREHGITSLKQILIVVWRGPVALALKHTAPVARPNWSVDAPRLRHLQCPMQCALRACCTYLLFHVQLQPPRVLPNTLNPYSHHSTFHPPTRTDARRHTWKLFSNAPAYIPVSHYAFRCTAIIYVIFFACSTRRVNPLSHCAMTDATIFLTRPTFGEKILIRYIPMSTLLLK